MLKRTSLILTGSTLRTRWVMVANRVPAVVGFVQLTFAVKKPASVVAGEVRWKVALTLDLASSETANVFEVLVGFITTIFQPLRDAMLNLTPFAGAPVLFVNDRVISCIQVGV